MDNEDFRLRVAAFIQAIWLSQRVQLIYWGEQGGKADYESGDWHLAVSTRRHAPEGKKFYIGGDVPPSWKGGGADEAAAEQDLAF